MSVVVDPAVTRPEPLPPSVRSTVRESPRLALLGGFDLTIPGDLISLPMTAQRVLAFLALQDRPMLRLFVAGSLWPETTESRASANLRSALWRLGRPGVALVDTTNGHLALSDGVDVDLRRGVAFARRLVDRTPAISEKDADPCWLSKDILPDWSEEWVVIEREHFRQLRLHALESLCQHLTALGRFPQAVDAGLAAIAAEPLRESAHRTLIKAHLAEGNLKEALHQYHTFRQLLHDELDLEPSDAMEELVRGLLAGLG
jgi:DNA-binding SARP family transcriptional activator